jgi:hypothetical protein
MCPHVTGSGSRSSPGSHARLLRRLHPARHPSARPHCMSRRSRMQAGASWVRGAFPHRPPSRHPNRPVPPILLPDTTRPWAARTQQHARPPRPRPPPPQGATLAPRTCGGSSPGHTPAAGRSSAPRPRPGGPCAPHAQTAPRPARTPSRCTSAWGSGTPAQARRRRPGRPGCSTEGGGCKRPDAWHTHKLGVRASNSSACAGMGSPWGHKPARRG